MTTASLYVHVPFCRSRCSYCSFVSYPVGDAEREEAVVRRTVEDTAAWARRVGGLAPATVYVGGGTPSALQPGTLAALLGGLREIFAADPSEFTVEANPDSLTPAFLRICAEHGVNRLSLGIQTFAPDVRRSAGRRCPEPDIRRCRDLVAHTWGGELSLDLIAGFSDQSSGDVARDSEMAATWRPGHVSLYTLTLEEHRGSLRKSAQADDLWLEGFERLEELGYANYEICNFARPGHECRHNLVYWRLDPYIGVGPSAVSTMPGEDGTVLRVQCPSDLATFLGPPRSPVDGAEHVGPRDLVFEALMMGLRLRDGLDRGVLERRLGRAPESVLPRTLGGWASRSLLRTDPGRLALSREGRLLLDALLVEAREEMDDASPEVFEFHWP